LPHQRFHDLRHACASLLLAQGLDLKVIQEVLGHSTITITGDLYAHVLMGLKRQAADRMDAVLEPEPARSPRERPGCPPDGRALRFVRACKVYLRCTWRRRPRVGEAPKAAS
jgi:hypothetical protein